MKKKYLVLISFLVISFSVIKAQLLAFPTAEGAGKFVTGGRGTITSAPTVLIVTSLIDNSTAANTPGTFRYACTKSGFVQRIIVFRITGTIHLYAPLTLNRANTTIAGQTAPGEGICIADHPVKVSANNIIIRYMRFRLGDKNQAATLGNDDALDGVGVQKVIIDHCSISWSNDEACTFYNGDNITLQWNVISEPLDYSFHDEGAGIQNHSYGGIWGGKHATFHHNLIAHCKGRMPRFDGLRSSTADTGDFRNNVVYNWGDYNTNGGEGGTYNVVNNYYKYGPNTPNTSTGGVNRRNMLINPGEQASPAIPYGTYFLMGNYCDNSATITNQNWRGAAFSGGVLADSTNSKVNSPFNCININMQSAIDAYTSVLATAGCSLPNRDTMDARIIKDVKNRTGKIIDVQGGFVRGTPYSVSQIAWPTLATGFVQLDTDNDGMPDAWENARGLNAASAADINGYIATSGYNNIENYINGDTIVAVGKIGQCVTAKNIDAQNTMQWLLAKDSSYCYYLSNTYTASTDSNHIVAAIFDNGNYGLFNTAYFVSNTIRYHTPTAKPYLNRNITITPLDASLINNPIKVRLYISAIEFNALKLADPSINSIADVAVLQSTDINCLNQLPNNYTVIAITASGSYGTYRTGYFIEFETSSFGTFFIGSKISFPLPVQLLSFNANVVANTVVLKWVTDNEINSNQFIIERSIDAINFVSIASTAAINMAGTHVYTFIDKQPAAVAIVFYRLKMVDTDGKYAYSKIVNVKFTSNAILIKPNPVDDAMWVMHPLAKAGAVLKIVDVTGSIILQKIVSNNTLQTQINTASFAAGQYILVFINGAEISTTKFIKKK